MNQFFVNLLDYQLIEDWAKILDWLLSEDRFSEKKGWTPHKIGQFTKKIKKLDNFNKSNFIADTGKNISYEKIDRTVYPMVVINTSQSEGRELLRHIRNGIAHGNVSLKKIREANELYITIEDFKSGSKTAYIHIPIAYISEMQKIYHTLETNKATKRKSKE